MSSAIEYRNGNQQSSWQPALADGSRMFVSRYAHEMYEWTTTFTLREPALFASRRQAERYAQVEYDRRLKTTWREVGAAV